MKEFYYNFNNKLTVSLQLNKVVIATIIKKKRTKKRAVINL